MAQFTERYGLSRTRPPGALSDDDFKHLDQDREMISRLLYRGAEAHVHDGEGPAIEDPTAPLSWEVTSGGTLRGGKTYRYKFTWVDADGAETAASPEVVVPMPSPLPRPGAPTVTPALTGGLLPFGNHYYMLTAYVDSNTRETLPSERVFAQIASGNTGVVVLTFPTLPAGADGWNIYKREPGQSAYYYLDSVDMTSMTPPTDYADDGTVEIDCNRTPPTVNGTANNNAVQLIIPGATPVVPEGLHWKIYRTDTEGDWAYSTLAIVTEETEEGSGIVTPEFLDTGSPTTAGSYPLVSQIVGSPSKIHIGLHTEGSLPITRLLQAVTVNFSFPGILAPTIGEWAWRCPYDKAQLIIVGAHLAPGSAPASDPVQLDVRRYDYATETWDTVFEVSEEYVEIPAGEMIGDFVDPLDNSNTNIVFVQNDLLRVDIIQAGGGATPTDFNLVVTALLYARPLGDPDEEFVFLDEVEP